MKPIDDQVILITGATDGLGKAVAIELAKRGATVLAHGRNPDKGGQLLYEITTITNNTKARFYQADFASLTEVDRLAVQIQAQEPRLDVLVNNAGIGVEDRRCESRDGYEVTFQVNYLSGFLLTSRLIPLLERSAPARIVNIASAGQTPIDFDDVMLKRHWNGVQAYCQAKLAQIMMTIDLADELVPRGITINALHPASYMPTKIVVGRFCVQSTIEEGVANTVRLIADPSLAGSTGRYFDRNREARAELQAYDAKARATLRVLSGLCCKSCQLFGMNVLPHERMLLYRSCRLLSPQSELELVVIGIK